MAVKLTQSEANMLIEMLKKAVEKKVVFPQGRGKAAFHVVGDGREDIFVVNISRKGISDRAASYQGRVSASGVILMRLDVNPASVHINPDGERIMGTHLHIYSEKHAVSEAVSFDVENKDLYQLCYTFFKRFNIIEPPYMSQQMALEEI